MVFGFEAVAIFSDDVDGFISFLSERDNLSMRSFSLAVLSSTI